MEIIRKHWAHVSPNFQNTEEKQKKKTENRQQQKNKTKSSSSRTFNAKNETRLTCTAPRSLNGSISPSQNAAPAVNAELPQVLEMCPPDCRFKVSVIQTGQVVRTSHSVIHRLSHITPVKLLFCNQMQIIKCLKGYSCFFWATKRGLRGDVRGASVKQELETTNQLRV